MLRVTQRLARIGLGLLAWLPGLAWAAAQTIHFNGTSFSGFPSSFTDTGFAFSATSNQVANGGQPYFQTCPGDGGRNGIKFASLTLATDTVTIRRSDNRAFAMVSWVRNLTSNKTITVEGRFGATVVKLFTVAANTA